MLYSLGISILAILASSPFTSAVPQPEKRYNVQVIDNCYNQGQVALTFDDGPYNYDQNIVSQLGDNKATFFFNGNNYDCIYNRYQDVRALYDAGHTLGSHTWSHAHLNSLSWDQIHNELWKVEEAFIKILGVKPLYFRPPYGEYNDLVLAALDARGYKKMLLWSEDTGDASGASVASSQAVLNGVADSYPAPHMVLSHSTVESTASQLLPSTLGNIWSKGYKFVAVDTCLGSSGEWPYEWVKEREEPNDSWRC